MRLWLKIACLLGAAIVLAAAAVLWQMHLRNSPRMLSGQAEGSVKLPQNAGAPTSLSGRPAVYGARGAIPSGHPAAGRSLIPENSPNAFGARVQRPGQALAANKVTRAQEALPPGLERVRIIVSGASGAMNADTAAGFAERVDAIRAIKTELTGPEVDAFSRYLRTPTPQSGQDPEGENWLRNEMMDKLVQQTAPPGLSDLLVAVYKDPAQDVVMRDYAVQHMAPAYEQVSAKEQANLRDALWQATTETDTSIAGTAILTMLDITQAEPTMDQGRLADTAFKLAADDRCGELARITAVQVCGRMGVEQALPIVEQLAQTAPSMPLRIAATAALGDIGGPGAEDILKRLVVSADPPQVLAAQSALLRLARAQTLSAARHDALAKH